MIRSLFVFLLFLTVSFSAIAREMTLPIGAVTDGDTIRSYLKLPCPLCSVSIRIIGIDTPESTYLARCAKEKELALQAKNVVKTLVAGQEYMQIYNFKWDKYGGRINAVVVVNGIDIGQELINRGLAVPYTGSGPKHNWCN